MPHRRVVIGATLLLATLARPGAAAAESDWNPLALRWEAGVAHPREYFEWLATAAYHRRVRLAEPLAHLVRAEVAGGSRGYLSEGSASLYYLFEPVAFARSAGRAQTAIDFGPGGHIVVQSASIDGFDESSVHAEVFLKAHAYAWVIVGVGSRVAVGLSGRLSIPNHRPLDYAQAAVLFK